MIYKFMAHEVAFLLFLGITAVRLLFTSGGRGSACQFAGIVLILAGTWLWWRREPSDLRWRMRLLILIPVMGISYAALSPSVRLIIPPGAPWLQAMDNWLLGGNASVWMQPLVHPALTDLFSFLYLAFFGYIGWAICDYGRGELGLFKNFIRGLFTVYGVGFFSYTLVSAGGPYYEMSDKFTVPLEGGWMTDVYQTLVLHGSNHTDCFPCLHLAITGFILFFDRWHRRWRFRWMLLPCLGIWVSTLYLRQHYFVDLLGGVVLMAAALWMVRPKPRFSSGTPTNSKAAKGSSSLLTRESRS